MTEALDNLIIDAFLIAIMGAVPVVIGVAAGWLYESILPKSFKRS